MNLKISILTIFTLISLVTPLCAQSADGVTNVNKTIQSVQSAPDKSIINKIPVAQEKAVTNEDLYKYTVKSEQSSKAFKGLVIRMARAFAVVLVVIFIIFGVARFIKSNKKINFSNSNVSENHDYGLGTPKTISSAVVNFIKKNI